MVGLWRGWAKSLAESEGTQEGPVWRPCCVPKMCLWGERSGRSSDCPPPLLVPEQDNATAQAEWHRAAPAWSDNTGKIA
jgi:hypothetical protein